MARPIRLCLPDITYHVFSQCIERRDMIRNNYFKDMLIEVMRSASGKYQFELVSYQILDNHFHFIIKTLPNGPNISRIMQFIKARFAERYNKMTNRTGPFWNERFKNVIIEHTENPAQYLLWLLWYLAFNPVRKELTNDPRKYKYGSINFYLDNSYRPPLKITHHKYFIDLGESFPERAGAFSFYEEAYRNNHW